MTNKNLTTWIEKEVNKLNKEIKAIKPSCLNENLRNYLVSRKSTLLDVKALITKAPL